MTDRPLASDAARAEERSAPIDARVSETSVSRSLPGLLKPVLGSSHPSWALPKMRSARAMLLARANAPTKL